MKSAATVSAEADVEAEVVSRMKAITLIEFRRSQLEGFGDRNSSSSNNSSSSSSSGTYRKYLNNPSNTAATAKTTKITKTSTLKTAVLKPPSFRDIPFESEIMKNIVNFQNPTAVQEISIEDLTYKCSDIFPDWITSDVEWKGVRKTSVGSVSDILSRYLRSIVRSSFFNMIILERTFYGRNTNVLFFFFLYKNSSMLIPINLFALKQHFF